MLTTFNDDPDLLKNVTTGDELWLYDYDIETKVQSYQWKPSEEPRPKNARQVQPNVKVLLTVFFNCNGVMHHEFLPQYCNITMKLCANYTKQFVKFGQMWRFCSLFSSIAMGWCIMNFCKKVVRSIRYTALKFCADCAKQFVRNAQNCGKTSHGFCTIITHQLREVILKETRYVVIDK